MHSYYTNRIQTWKDAFENNPAWKDTTFKTLEHPKGTRPLNLLNVSKVLCDYFSDLSFSEQIEIKISDENMQNFVDDTFEVNGFWDNVPELLSIAFAFGGCAIKTYAENSEVKLSYVHADKFIPTAWTGSRITEAIFISQTVKSKKYYTLIEKQSIGKIEFKLYKSDNSGTLGTPCPLSEIYGEMSDAITLENIDMPMFTYFKPCISNNAEYDTPLGMSIFANSLDTLKALDITFDSFAREVVLGKKRIIVPYQAIKTIPNEDGEIVRYFDTNDEAFVAFKTEDTNDLKITDNTATLRISEHVQAINALLNILCFQVGLSAGSLSFDAVQGMKTATEVISQDSKTARTAKSNKNLLVEMFETVVHSVVGLGVALGQLPKIDYDVTISFKDNIIIDDNTLIDNNIKLVQSGLKSKLSAIMEVLKCDEKTAQEELDRINSEQSVTGLAVDDLMGKDEVNVDDETIKDGETDDETGTNAN